MSAIIRFGPTLATFNDGVWSSSDITIAECLNRVSPCEANQISASEPSSEEALARRCAAIFGGDFVSSSEPEEETDLDPYVVY